MTFPEQPAGGTTLPDPERPAGGVTLPDPEWHTYKASNLHVCCIQKNWYCPKCAAHKHMRRTAYMHAYCVQLFIRHTHAVARKLLHAIHAAHNHCTHCAHFAEMCADLICLCVAQVWRGSNYCVCSIYATKKMSVFCEQHICSM